MRSISYREYFKVEPLVETEVGLDNGVLNDSSLPTKLELAQHLLSSTTGVPAASQSFLKILHLGLQRIENLDHFCYFKKIKKTRFSCKTTL